MTTTKYDTDAPETKDQAEALLKDYYKTEKAKETGATPNKLPKRPNLLSWKLRENAVMVVVDGASGRKLEFVTDPNQQAKAQAEEQAEDAEQAALDAQAEAQQARALADAAEAKAKEANAAATKKASKTFEKGKPK